MRNRTIRIPGFLQVLHGERPSLLEVVLVYATAGAFATLALLFALSRVSALPAWKAVLLWIVAADTSGGVVATFTPSTGRFYASRPGLRWIFLLVHVLHPAALYLLFGGRPVYWAFLYAYTLAAASAVNILGARQIQETVAVVLLILGMALLLPIFQSLPFLAWFGPLFMLKLILAFAVRRT